MEAMMLASVLLHPGAGAVLTFAVFGAVFIGAEVTEPYQRLSHGRLLAGFMAVLVVALAIVAAGSYVTPETAAKLGVQAEDYWSTLWRQFMTLAVLLGYLSLLDCAVFGVPIVTQLAKRQCATVPLVVAASVPVSLVIVGGLAALSTMLTPRLVKDVVLLVALHAVLALGFALGVGLPWRRPSGVGETIATGDPPTRGAWGPRPRGI